MCGRCRDDQVGSGADSAGSRCSLRRRFRLTFSNPLRILLPESSVIVVSCPPAVQRKSGLQTPEAALHTRVGLCTIRVCSCGMMPAVPLWITAVLEWHWLYPHWLYLHNRFSGRRRSMRAMSVEQTWSGSFPVSEVHRFDGDCRISLIGDSDVWDAVWHAFRPQSPLPRVDFATHRVLVVRNVEFVNPISLRDAELSNGLLTVVISEARTARPISDTLQCLLLLVDVQTLAGIRCGDQTIHV